MLIHAAQEAGMSVPEDADNFSAEHFPHFNVFCNMQLGAAMPYPGCHFDNAKIIKDIPDDKILTVKVSDIIALGFHYSQ